MGFEIWGTKLNWIMKHCELHRVFFTSLKNIQLNAFSFGQEGWSYFFPALYHCKYLLGSWPHFFLSFWFLLSAFTPSREPQYLHTLPSHRLMEIPHMPLEMLITKERHNGFTAWYTDAASRGFWCLHFMGHLLSCLWNALVLWGLHLT